MASLGDGKSLLWRIGLEDGKSAEFTGSALPKSCFIGHDWRSQTTWPDWPAKVTADPSVSTIEYALPQAPKYGAIFTFKPTQVSALVPELAVYSNNFPCGIIQLAGCTSPGWGPPQKHARLFAKEYKIYIPAEFLSKGSNRLQIKRLGNPYNRDSAIFLNFGIDYMKLSALEAPASEPIHGTLTHIGYSDGEFDINPKTIAKEQEEAEWMGVAYSGNPARVGFFNDLTGIQSETDKLAQLQKMKSLNMTVILDGWNCARTTDSMLVNGQLPVDAKTYIDDTIGRYGSYARFYEICNEPCQGITNASLKYCAAVARHVNELKPKSMILAAPGYAFGGSQGDPVNWDDGQHDESRKSLDDLCGAYNGHSFGLSYWMDNGSLAENIDAHGVYVNGDPQITDGWDKPMITTECGSATSHTDFREATDPSHSFSSVLDRNMRSNLAVADYLCAADIWNNGEDYDFLRGTPTEPATWTAAPADPKGKDIDSRVKVLRRLALAYATHGTPLPYIWNNIGADLPLVYFRAVDTSTLTPIPGSEATSKKLLLSFVNFDTLHPNTISVRVTMPVKGSYAGIKYNGADSFTAARSEVSGLIADPTCNFTVNLGPGESVEYILDRPQGGRGK